MARCIICEKEGCRYKCRRCQSPYCSAACSQTHRAEGCGSMKHEEKYEYGENRRVGEDEIYLDERERSGSQGTSTITSRNNNNNNKKEDAPVGVKRGRDGEDAFIYGQRDEDNALIVLGEAHLAALAQNTNIRRKLRSEELQRLIRVIDSSRSRIDALEAAMANTREFKTFCDEVLSVVAEAEINIRPRVI